MSGIRSRGRRRAAGRLLGGPGVCPWTDRTQWLLRSAPGQEADLSPGGSPWPGAWDLGDENASLVICDEQAVKRVAGRSPWPDGASGGAPNSATALRAGRSRRAAEWPASRRRPEGHIHARDRRALPAGTEHRGGRGGQPATDNRSFPAGARSVRGRPGALLIPQVLLRRRGPDRPHSRPPRPVRPLPPPWRSPPGLRALWARHQPVPPISEPCRSPACGTDRVIAIRSPLWST